MTRKTEERLQENIALWSHSHPKEAIWLQFVEVDHLLLSKQSDALRYEDGNFSFSYHSLSDPLGESRERLKSFAIEDTEIVFIYGVGLGYDFLAAKEWLKEKEARRLIFLEDNLGVIYRFFETETASELLNHSQVQLTYVKNLEDADMIFNELFWHYYGRSFKIFPSQAYQKYRARFFEELKHRLTYDMQTKYSLLEEYLEYGAAFYRNFYMNVLKWDQALLGNRLFGKFKRVPAIICGAGPSLENSLKTLKNMKNKALIFGGSSSLNAMLHAGVSPHFGVGIDPNAKQADRLRELPRLDYPFFYRQRLFPEALDLLKGPRLYMTGTGGYEIAGWFEKKLGIEEEEIEEGRNVVNFSLEIAYRMGCSPIIFVGMDLGFTGCKLYSPGVISKDNAVEVNEIDPKSLGEDLLLKEDINGRPLYTLWKWISESKWVSDFAKEHPDVKLINATEGGLGFEGVENQNLSVVCDEYLVKSYRLPSRIAAALDQAALPQVTQKSVRELMDQLREGLIRCLESLSVLQEENEKMRDVIEKQGHVEPLQTPYASLVEIELADEEAFQAVLEIFNAVYTKVLDKEVKDLSDPTNSLSDAEKDLRKIDLNKRKYIFLSEVAQVNLKLLEFAMKGLYR